jgi:L-alanine-DL-glutamate epimerase-like enolase superfamily enzyme
MRITAVYDIVVPIASQISNAYINFSEMTASAVAIHTDVVKNGRPMLGFGFHSNGRYAQRGLLRERFIPRLLAADPNALVSAAGDNFDPEKAWTILMKNEKPGGHGERSVAVGTLDMALWDLVAKIEDRPLYAVVADRFGNGAPKSDAYVYAAGGYYYPGKDVQAVVSEVKGYLEAGYTTAKIKIGGASLADDLKRIEGILSILPPGGQLAVDANGRFDSKTALAYTEALNQYSLKWYEEPGDPLDYEIMKEVAAASRNPVATGENLFSSQDARNLARYGGMDSERDFLQMDPALSYGLVEYVRTLETLRPYGWARNRCIPHGGHQFALHLAAGLDLHGNESYPGVFEPFGGFADNTPVVNGRIALPDAPGIGIECKRNLYAVFREL